MQQGYIKLYRCICDSEFWSKKPFDTSRAWIDLLLLANHKDGGYWLRGIYINVLRGQVGHSQSSLAEKWGWSRWKVKHFLNTLQVLKQVSLKTVQQNQQQNKYLTTLIIIENYDKYQQDQQQKRPQTDSRPTADRQQTDTNKNEKNEKNVKNVKELTNKKNIQKEKPKPKANKNFFPAVLDVSLEEEFKNYNKQAVKDFLLTRKEKKMKLTLSAWNGIKRNAKEANLTPEEVIRKMAENSWGSFKSSWLKTFEEKRQEQAQKLKVPKYKF